MSIVSLLYGIAIDRIKVFMYLRIFIASCLWVCFTFTGHIYISWACKVLGKNQTIVLVFNSKILRVLFLQRHRFEVLNRWSLGEKSKPVGIKSVFTISLKAQQIFGMARVRNIHERLGIVLPDVAICQQQQLPEKGAAESALASVEAISRTEHFGSLSLVCIWSEIDGYVD